MITFEQFDIDAKILSLTISYQFKTVYLTFQALSDVFVNTDEKMFARWERCKLKLSFSELSELQFLNSIFDKPQSKLKAIIRLNNNCYEKEISKDSYNKDIKTVKILSLE